MRSHRQVSEHIQVVVKAVRIRDLCTETFESIDVVVVVVETGP